MKLWNEFLGVNETKWNDLIVRLSTPPWNTETILEAIGIF